MQFFKAVRIFLSVMERYTLCWCKRLQAVPFGYDMLCKKGVTMTGISFLYFLFIETLIMHDMYEL